MALTLKLDDRTKAIGAIALLALAAWFVYAALRPDDPGSQAAPASRPNPVASSDNPSQPGTPARPPASRGARARRSPAQPPPGIVDPKLNVELLAKAEGITYDGTGRNIFQYHVPPPPPPPTPVAPAVVNGAKKEPAPPPAPPPPPPIPLKFYGYAHKPGETQKKAFFVLNDDIFIASEGEVVSKRYKIVKIGVNTVEVEDTVTNHKQVLPLQEQP